jgi:hypothetical protein
MSNSQPDSQTKIIWVPSFYGADTQNNGQRGDYSEKLATGLGSLVDYARATVTVSRRRRRRSSEDAP